MTAPDFLRAAPSEVPPTRAVTIEAAALTRCRRRVHLDHDPTADRAALAPPDPSTEQRQADAAQHRQQVGEQLAAAAGADWVAIPPGRTADRLRATEAAVAVGAPFVWGAALPAVAGRRGGAELLVRLSSGGYVPVVVVRHRISDPGEGAVTSPLTGPRPELAVPDPGRRVRSQPRDLLRLAHLRAMLAEAGWGPAADAPFATVGGVIGMDADVVVWHDLAGGTWPDAPSTLDEYERRFRDRLAVAGAAASGAPALAEPSRVLECRHCRWWPLCERRLLAIEDVSLVVRGEAARVLRTAGVRTVRELAAVRAAAPPEFTAPMPTLPDMITLARAWLEGRAVVRRVPRVPVVRADIEVDIDMESFGESGAYLWGTLLSHPGGARPGDEPEGYRAFVTWEPLPTVDEARSFAEFWGWLRSVRERAAATGRSFAAYCYNEQAENRWLVDSVRRFAGLPGIPTLAEVKAFIDDPGWVDLYAVVDSWFLCAQGKGLKKVAPAAGFAWHDPEAGGENSMRWYRAAVGLDGAPPDPAQRQRLLRYNNDDVEATYAIRRWMTSPAIDDVPLAADLPSPGEHPADTRSHDDSRRY